MLCWPLWARPVHLQPTKQAAPSGRPTSTRRSNDMLTVGDKFPSFDLKAVVSLERDKEFRQVRSQDFPGRWKVVFFWPKDFPFVCPTEIAEFGRRNGDFQDRDAQVLGVSID